MECPLAELPVAVCGHEHGADRHTACLPYVRALAAAGALHQLQTLSLRLTTLKQVSEFLPLCTSLEHFEVSVEHMCEEAIAELLESLMSCTQLKSWGLTCNTVSESILEQFRRIMPSCEKLLRLRVNVQGIPLIAIGRFAGAMTRCQGLRELSLRNSGMTRMGLARFIDVLKFLPHLELVDIFGNQLTVADKDILARAVAEHPSLKFTSIFSELPNREYDELSQYGQLLNSGSHELENLQLYICGDAGVGKSTLVRSLATLFAPLEPCPVLPGEEHSPFPSTAPPSNQNVETARTCDDLVSDSTQKAGSLSSDDLSCVSTITDLNLGDGAKFKAFDFAGISDSFKFNNMFVFHNSALFVVLLDSRQEVKDIEASLATWLQLICSQCPATEQPNVLLVASHVNSAPQQLERETLTQLKSSLQTLKGSFAQAVRFVHDSDEELCVLDACDVQSLIRLRDVLVSSRKGILARTPGMIEPEICARILDGLRKYKVQWSLSRRCQAWVCLHPRFRAVFDWSDRFLTCRTSTREQCTCHSTSLLLSRTPTSTLQSTCQWCRWQPCI
eukprot:m.712102 g.712102  ORF g.712102 m.712102 type:complete len:560 (-) comp58774_c0_seq7:3020-4699(-)